MAAGQVQRHVCHAKFRIAMAEGGELRRSFVSGQLDAELLRLWDLAAPMHGTSARMRLRSDKALRFTGGPAIVVG
jgi:hypothetical protein